MSDSLFPEIPSLVGVIHLPPLPGSPLAMGRCTEALQIAGELALDQAKKLEKAGFQALILENYSDVPFVKDEPSYETVAAFSILAAAVKEVVKLPIGINVLRNAGLAAQAIAAAARCEFIRINILSGTYATDQGLIEGKARQLAIQRTELGHPIQCWADVRVKHASPLVRTSIAQETKDLILRSGATTIVVTGRGTGEMVSEKVLIPAARTCGELKTPLFIGSGANEENISALLEYAHGIIIGSSIRRYGLAGESLDDAAVRRVVKAFEKAQKSKRKTKSKTKRKKS